MKNTLVKNALATIAGLVTAVIVVMVAESVGHLIFPPPEGLDLRNPDDQAKLMEVIPTGAKVAVVIAWFLGAFAGSAVAIGIARHALPGWIVTGLLIAMSVATTQMFPHPAWMMASAIALPVIAGWLALRWQRGRIEKHLR